MTVRIALFQARTLVVRIRHRHAIGFARRRWILLFGAATLAMLALSLGWRVGSITRAEPFAAGPGSPGDSPAVAGHGEKSPEDLFNGSWLSGGPYIASVRQLLISPAYATDRLVFAGTWGSGIFRWQESGREWLPISQGIDPPRFFALAMSPSFQQDRTLLAALHGGGVYRSVDGGTTWSQADVGLPNRSVRALAFSPAYAADYTIYAGLNGSGVYRSTDGAQSWTPAASGLDSQTVVEIQLAPDFASSRRAFARVDQAQISHTSNGVIWTACTFLPNSLIASALAISPDGATLFAGTTDGLFVSTDNCASWAAVPGRNQIRMWIDDVVLSPVFGSDRTMWVTNGDRGIYRSTDAGVRWTQVFSGAQNNVYPTSLAVSPGFAADRTIVAGNYGGSGGIYISTDAGDNWSRQSSGLTAAVYELVASPTYASDQTLYAGLNGGGIVRSSNRGASWQPANLGYPTGTDAVAIALSPQFAQDNTLFAGGYASGVYRSTDRGNTWVQVGLANINAIFDLAISPGASLGQSVILAATENDGVYRSTDGGTQWSLVASLSANHTSEIAFTPSFASDATVFVGTVDQKLYRSRDGGLSWEHLSNGLQGDHVFALAVSPGYGQDHTVLLATDSGLFRSQNGGESWTVLAFPWQYEVATIAFSPHFSTDRTIWAGTTKWVTSSLGGVFVSRDVGASWQQINDGLTQLSHYAITTADRAGPGYDVLVGTQTQGVWQRYGDVDLLVRARGGFADGEWPRLQARVNDATVADWTIDTGEYTLWTASAALTGQDHVDLWYANDTGPRTAWVDFVQVGDTIVDASDGLKVVFDEQDYAIEHSSFDGLQVADGRDMLYSGGALRFSVGIPVAPPQLPHGLPIQRVIDDTLVNDDPRPSWTHQWEAAIDSNAAGNAVMTWRDNRRGENDVYVARLGAQGVMGANIRVNDNQVWGDQRYPDVLVNHDGSFVVVWGRLVGSNHQIYLQRYGSDGTAFGSNQIVTDQATCYVYPSIDGQGDGSFVVTWSSNWTGEIWMQRFNAAGQPLAVERRINELQDGDLRRRHSRVAVAPDGSSLIVWQEPRRGNLDIWGQWFDAGGNAVGGNFRIDDDTGNAEQITPDVAMDGSGNTVVTWRDKRNGHEDIYGQRFGANRLPIEVNFRVNDDTSQARQYAPRVAVSPAGAFIIAWLDQRSAEPDTYAQYYDRFGTSVQGNFQVINASAVEDYGPDLAMGDDQDAWFAWYGNRDGYLDVYFSRWAAVGTPTPTPTVTPSVINTPMPTTTPTPTTPTPQAGDAYEPDDTCGSANALAPDGTLQHHTFHANADIDWVRFQATANTRYVITGRHTGPSADVMAWLYNSCGDPSPVQDDDFGSDTILTWTAPTTGMYYLRLANHDPTVFGANVSYQVSVRAVSTGAAIVAGGRLYNNEQLQPQITFMTNHAYQVFQQAGYDHDDIYYLSADPVPPANVDAPSLTATLQYAITTWAAGHLLDGDPLYIYLGDHGQRELFYLDTGSQVASTAQLETWLLAFESQRPNSPVVLIVEACYSGSFITPIQTLARPGRVLVSATGDNNLSYARPAGEGGAYFSDALFDALGQSYSLWDSYQLAQQAVQAAQGSLQTPWIDGDGDGLPYPQDTDDNGAGRNLGLGRPSGFAGQAPYIEPPAVPQPTGTQPVPIQVQVLDEHRPSTSVWIMVTKPSTPPPSPPPGYTTPVSHAERVNLVYNPANDRFEVAFTFDERGLYQFEFNARDASDQQAQPLVITVRNGRKVFLPMIRR